MKNYIYHCLLLFLCSISLFGCANSQIGLYKKLSKEDPYNTHYKGHYKTGKEYTINGKKYKPKNVTHYNQTGIASWYGSKHGFHGKKTANGDKYNKHLLSAAHKTLPLPSLARVTNLKNNKSLIVMINDRGPFAKNRLIDVSEKAAEILSFKKQGVTKVKVEYLHKETQEFLKNISLNRKEGAIAKHSVRNKVCSVNCHIKLVNLKYKLAVNP